MAVVELKFVPVIVIRVPPAAGPDDGLILVTTGKSDPNALLRLPARMPRSNVLTMGERNGFRPERTVFREVIDYPGQLAGGWPHKTVDFIDNDPPILWRPAKIASVIEESFADPGLSAIYFWPSISP